MFDPVLPSDRTGAGCGLSRRSAEAKRSVPDVRTTLRLALFGAWASVLLAACPGASLAGEPELPCRAPDIEQERRTVIDRDRLVDVQLGDKKFRVPYAYFSPRPFASHLNCDPKIQPLSFAFWMPDLRPTQRDMWYVPSYRPREEGRPEPQAGEYIVEVPVVKLSSTGEKGGAVPPSLQLRNRLGLYDRDFRLKQEGDLIHVLPMSNSVPFEIWFNLEREGDAIYIRCSRAEESKSPNPNCQASVLLRDLGISADVIFLREVVPDWSRIVDGLRTLLKRWSGAG